MLVKLYSVIVISNTTNGACMYTSACDHVHCNIQCTYTGTCTYTACTRTFTCTLYTCVHDCMFPCTL